jgi:molybdopterin molybdotransferase
VIELEEALGITAAAGAARFPVETVTLEHALGRVLAAAVVSPIDSPPFAKSAMDGFAVRADDTSSTFRVVDVLAAGASPRAELRTGECARIMTGAMLPPGAGRVIRKELVDEEAGIIRPRGPESGSNVIPRGANLHAGDVVLAPKRLAPQDIGILAASGVARVDVAVPPTVGILSTGSEIRAPGEPLGPGEIYNSSAAQITAQLAVTGCPARFLGAVADEKDGLLQAISRGLADCDVVLLTGGVSAGDFDFVPDCLRALGAEILFHGVAVKPGKPTLFARTGERFVFGLPGNPVSTFVIFEIFVKPFLFRRMGVAWGPTQFRGRLAQRVSRKGAERTEFLPVRVRAGEVFPVAYHGSAHLNAIGEADGLIRVEKGVEALEQGAEVDVRPL